MEPFAYRCPFCGQNATITHVNYFNQKIEFTAGNVHGTQFLYVIVTTCPNQECREYSLRIFLYDTKYTGPVALPAGGPKRVWQLVPQSDAKVLPSYIPTPIISDYNEACAIKALSPKASATLARRCLQGMIRDFWGIVKSRLIDEIEALQDKVDPLTWSAIDGLRRIGNIGAHMERDINVIVDVEPDEAELLIGLIENLVHDWYVVKHEREQRLKRLVQVSLDKDLQRKAGPASATTTANGEQEGSADEAGLPSTMEEAGAQTE